MKKVKIEIESTVEDIDDAGLVESSDKTHTEALGTLIEKDNCIFLSYSETNESITTKSDIIISDGASKSTRKNGMARSLGRLKSSELSWSVSSPVLGYRRRSTRIKSLPEEKEPR